MIGVLLCSYNCADTLEACLVPWLELKKELGLVISAVSVPFKEYRDFDITIDNTRELLDGYLARHDIDFLTTEPQFIDEAAARTLALRPLLSSGVDLIFILDADEVWTIKEICATLDFINQVDATWYAVNYKNLTFSESSYIEGFCPPRIFRVTYGGLRLDRFYFDNDILYADNGHEVDYKNLPKGIVPKFRAFPKHFSWVGEKTKQKVEYQLKHFGGLCSYRWNDITNSLEFDPSYFQKIGKPIPKLHKD